MCMQNQSHLSVLIQSQAAHYGERTALKYRDYDRGEWTDVSWREFADYADKVSRSLIALQVKVQERLAVFSQNKPECLYVDFGAYGVRAVTIPFYATSSAAQVAYMMNDAEVRLVFVGEQQQYDTLITAAPLCHTLQHIVIFDDAHVRRIDHDVLSMSFAEFLNINTAEPPCGNGHANPKRQMSELESEVERRRAEANYEDMANILYTSGTTGQSKGVILTHANYRAAIDSHNGVLPIGEDDVVMNFLPFTHVFERGWSYLCLATGCTLAVNLRPMDAQQSMQEVHPTCMAAVPRFWEKVYQAVLDKAEKGSSVQRKLIMEAIQVGGDYWEYYASKRRPAPLWLRTKHALYEKTIVPVLRKAIGIEKSACFPCAGAAISPEVERFVHAAGINMVAGYGLTESTATVSCDRFDQPVTKGSIGRALPGLLVKISDEGEILLKGPTITPGYYRKPEETARAIDAEGWFHTGDAGYLKDGELYMTERIKDLFKTSNGKYISPQLVEGRLTIDRYIEQVVIIADGRQFVSALVVPSYKLLEEYCQAQGIQWHTREEMCRHPEVHQMLWERIQTLQQDLAHYEQIKRFTIVPRAFTLDNDEITNTLKIKRRVVYAHYAEAISKMYDNTRTT